MTPGAPPTVRPGTSSRIADATRLAIAPARRTERSASALRLSQIIAAAVMCIAGVVMLGWILDVRILKGFLPGMISMKYPR